MITRDEWLKALGDAVQPVDPDALTIREIQQQFNITKHKAEDKMRALVAAGAAVRVVKLVQRSNGAPYRAPAYKLVKAKK